MYLAVQILLPLSPFLFPGGSEWIYMQHRFSWRMMLRYQSTHGYFYVTDPNTDSTYRVNPLQFLTIRRYLTLVFSALVFLLLVLAIWP